MHGPEADWPEADWPEADWPEADWPEAEPEPARIGHTHTHTGKDSGGGVDSSAVREDASRSAVK